MLRVAFAVIAVGFACLVAATPACSVSRSNCYAGDFAACTCANGARGYAACQPSEGLFVPCICDGTTPGSKEVAGDASTDAALLDAATSKRGFFEACASNEECTSGLCQEYPGKGAQLCTVRCTQSTATADCPPPSTGCNNQGVCKAP